MEKFLKYPNFALRVGMVEPYSLNSKSRKRFGGGGILKKIWFVFGVSNLIYQICGLIIYLIVEIDIESSSKIMIFAQISEIGAILGLCLVGLCKMILLFWHDEKIQELLKQFHSIFHNIKAKGPFDSLRFMGNASQRLMYKTTVFFLFAYTYYNSLPIVEIIYELVSPEHYIKFRHQSNTWYPWNSWQNPKTSSYAWLCFIISYICQMQSSLTGVAFIMAGEFTLCFFTSQMRMHFEYLGKRFESLDASDGDAIEELKRLIEYHNKLIGFSNTMNEIFNTSFVVNFVTASIAICLMGFSMLMISPAAACKYSVGLLSFLVFTLFICYNGSQFTAASSKIQQCAFHSNWYEGNYSYRQMMRFVIMRSSHPLFLKASKLAVVSIAAFQAILQLSYRLFTCFKAMV